MERILYMSFNITGYCACDCYNDYAFAWVWLACSLLFTKFATTLGRNIVLACFNDSVILQSYFEIWNSNLWFN